MGNKDSQNNVIFRRVRPMDDVRIPLRLATKAMPRLFKKYRPLFALYFTVVVALFSFGNIGYTFSYLSDTETSSGNSFLAGLLDFLVNLGNDGTLNVTMTATSTATIVPLVTPEAGSLPTLYKVTAEQTGGSSVFCNALNASATTSPFIYNGPLLSLLTVATTTSGTWNLGVTLATTTGLTHGDICTIDLVYRGWHPDAPEYTGFTDEERVHIIFTYQATASVFDIVLNEFLPNPDTSAGGLNFGDDNDSKPLGEWIELYNKGDVAQDIAGWFMTDASGGVGNTHAVIGPSNTNTGSTIIAAGGWLVVYMNKQTLNNSSAEEIHLYTATSTGGVEVDSYAYNNPSDFCENDPTPGGSNATSSPSGTPGPPPNSDCSQNQVAPNKSYARIPDGIGAWVDPIPTPGAPNILDPEEIVTEQETATTTPDEISGGDLGGQATATPEVILSGGGGGGGAIAPEPAPVAETPVVSEVLPAESESSITEPENLISEPSDTGTPAPEETLSQTVPPDEPSPDSSAETASEPEQAADLEAEPATEPEHGEDSGAEPATVEQNDSSATPPASPAEVTPEPVPSASSVSPEPTASPAPETPPAQSAPEPAP